MSPADAPSYPEWIERHHAAMQTPRRIIDAQVRSATGSDVDSVRRLELGEVNEVYDVATHSGRQVIVRISHEEDPRFEGERWALDAARAIGVPTPRVLHLEQADTGPGASVSFCVEEKLPGVPLDLLLERGVRPAAAIGQLGELLGALHGVRVDGFGYLQADGRGWPVTFASIMLDLVPQRAALLAAATHWRLEVRLVESGLEALTGNTALYAYDDPRLAHGDFSLDHVLIDGEPGSERVSGILDLQECSGNHPATDLAYWATISADQVPLADLLASYPGGADFAIENSTLIALLILRWRLHMLVVDHARGRASEIADHVRDIRGALESLERAV